MSGEREPLLGHAGSSRRSQGHGSVGSQVEIHGSLDSLTSEHNSTTMRDYRKYVKQCCNAEAAKNKLPIIKWLPKYTFNDAQCDIISGLTVALTVLPQGLAYAIIANLPQQYGLYSAFMGCFVYTVLGTSKDITLGPTAIMSLMTAAFATSPVEGDATIAIVLTLVCGVVQLLMGVLHLGILVNFISYPVINAFTSAAAITIACGQIKGILGLKDIPREFLHMIYETCKKIPETNVWDLTMGIVCLVVLFLFKQMRRHKWKDPAPGTSLSTPTKVFRKAVWLIGIGANAIVVITAAGVVAIMKKYDVEAVTVTGHVKSGLPPFKPPSFSLKNGNETMNAGDIFSHVGTGLFIVPILGLVESIAIGKAFARQNNYKILPNQELLAIGVANIVSSFVSSYPVTGSFSRTAVNSQSGVRTPMGGVVTGGVILLALAFLTPLFEYIPKSALAAVIISAVIQMVDYEILPKFWKIQKIALIPWVITFLTSFGLGIEYGILIGIGVQILILLYPVARPKITIGRRSMDQYISLEAPYSTERTTERDCVVVTFNQAIRFPSVEYLQAKVMAATFKENKKPKPVVLDCKHLVVGLDYTTIMGLRELVADFTRNDVHFAMAGVLPEIINELENADIRDVIYGDSVDDAISRIKEAEKAGKFEDELESVTVSNGKIVQATTVNGSPLPNVPQVNYGYDLDTDGEDTDGSKGVRL